MATVPPECVAAKQLLVEAGIEQDVGEVWKVIPAGESGSGCEVILFTTAAGRCYEAVVTKSEVEVYEDW